MIQRTILHADMNAFFAAVEQQNNPALRGQPVAVIGSAARTVITTCSYEARAFGVRTGMAVWQARQACPRLQLVVGDNRKYTWTSRQIVELMRQFTPLVEVFSIDEAFLDVTGSLALFGSAERIAYLLKAQIRHHFGLTCSVGIAPNKLLAKLASEMHKPDGLTVIPPDKIAAVLEGTPIKDLCGIGAKTARRLNLYGIETCGQLGRFPLEILRQRFGIVGEHLSRMGRGIDDTPVVPSAGAPEVKSVGHSTTLPRDISARPEMLKILLQLAEMVGRRARRHGVMGRTVTLSVRLADFDTWLDRQATLAAPIDQSQEIYRQAVAILDSLTLEQPVRLLGVRLSNLSHGSRQLPLFGDAPRKTQLVQAMDAVNNRHGDFTVTYASLIDVPKKGSHVISPAWRPDGIRQVDVG